MQKIFITYGSGNYMKSLDRIAREAKKLGIFSKVIKYTEKDMPLAINASPLKIYKPGNGYWVWKPYIIWKTLQDYPNSIVVYADAGCTLRPNMEEWNRWFELMEEYDTLTFQYRPEHYYEFWEEPEIGHKTTNLEYNKESFIQYFEPLIGRSWLSESQCMSGCIIACRNSKLIKMWMDITMMRPELIIDIYGTEIVGNHPKFQAHRHDQSVCTALSFYWQSQPDKVVKILPETAESCCNIAAVSATRIVESPNNVPLKTRVILKIKRRLGEESYDRLHSEFAHLKIVQKFILHLEHKGAKAYRNA